MSRQPLYYTFGNHMHWVDMQWLWGYHVLPGSVRDMIHLCREAGVKGCVNFDGIGYEKLAAEDPEALAELKAAVQEGLIEPVGCSYGQPYGLFHGGESNVRQLIYGARAVRRLLGVWPKTFWEEEFYFFPQLPQMLAGCGFTGASLFFQWTWHTPEVPKEESPVVWWEGMDGTRILATTRNALNMHQWPEDMDAVLSGLHRGLGVSPKNRGSDVSSERTSDSGVSPESVPLIQQWLELMPSPDWMCRSELILPKLKELLSDPRFEIRPVTLGEYLGGLGVSPKFPRGSDVPSEYSSGSDVPSEEASGSDVPSKHGPTRIAAGGISDGTSEPHDETRHPWGPAADDLAIEKRKGAFLPHWSRDGAIYAVTFRLEDSLPERALAEYRFERERLEASGALSGEALNDAYDELHRENIDGYLNAGHGACILREPRVGGMVYDALLHFDDQRYDLLACAVMQNHVHAVLWPKTGHALDGILKSWKSFTGHEIGRITGKTGSVWQAESYDRLVRGPIELIQQVVYVAENPAQAGLVDWPWVFVAGDKIDGLCGSDLGRDVRATGELGRDAQATGSIPVRAYSMDQVWHGMTLGKNGDQVRRRSREMEQSLQAMESLSAVLGLFGRPYAQWDVYPVWELEELWRDLLWTQHHDIDECEGLCGYIADGEEAGMRQRIGRLQGNIATSNRPSKQCGRFNPHGWEVGGIGPYGFGPEVVAPRHEWKVDDAFKVAFCEWDGLVAKVDLETGCLTEIRMQEGENLLASPLFLIATRRNDSVIENLKVRVDKWALFVSCLVDGESYAIHCMPVTGRGLNVYPSRQRTSRKEGGYRGAHCLKFDLALGEPKITTDTPYGLVLVDGTSAGSRKYPEGDWMTSPQWFEEVEGGFTGGSCVVFRDQDNERGLLVSQTASTQWFRHDGRYEMVCAAYDPWDEDRFHDEDNRVFNLIPIWRQSNADCWKVANTHREPLGVPCSHRLPWSLRCKPKNVVVTAFYREAEDFAGKHVENYAGKGMGYPFIVRLVEFDGIESDVELKIVGPVAKAYKTNLLGQIESEIAPVGPSPHPQTPSPSGTNHPDREGAFQYDTLRFHMRPHEIATLYLDIVPGRKQTRDLDAKREIWATVHRVD